MSYGAYSERDFNLVEPISHDATVGELVARLRDEFKLVDLNQFVKDGIAENLRWLPPYQMPISAVENTAEAMTTRAVLQAPAAVRIAVALLVRDLILPAMTKQAETGLHKRQKSKAGV